MAISKYEVYMTPLYDGPFPDGLEYIVQESDTDQTVFVSNSERTCRVVAKKLNAGGGFNGWTPSFILENRCVIK